MYPAVITILRSVDLLTQMMLTCWAQMVILLVLIYLHTAVTILYHVRTATVNFGIWLWVALLEVSLELYLLQQVEEMLLIF